MLFLLPFAAHAFQLTQLSHSAAVASRVPSPALLLGIGEAVEGTVPATIGDAKTAFQAAFRRPVSGPQQGFVNEMLTATVLAMASTSYRPSRIFYLGFESLCTTFLNGTVTDSEKVQLKSALCTAVGLNEARLIKEADALTSFAAGKTEDELLASEDFVAAKGSLKYSYPLGAGLLALMPMVGAEVNEATIEKWSAALGLPAARLSKDNAFFEDAQRKLVEVRQMMMEMSAAAKRKEAAKLKEEAEKAAKEAEEAESAASEAAEQA